MEDDKLRHYGIEQKPGNTDILSVQLFYSHFCLVWSSINGWDHDRRKSKSKDQDKKKDNDNKSGKYDNEGVAKDMNKQLDKNKYKNNVSERDANEGLGQKLMPFST